LERENQNVSEVMDASRTHGTKYSHPWLLSCSSILRHTLRIEPFSLR
jgi:hypothetical protein